MVGRKVGSAAGSVGEEARSRVCDAEARSGEWAQVEVRSLESMGMELMKATSKGGKVGRVS